MSVEKRGKAWFADKYCRRCTNQDECAGEGGLFNNMQMCIEAEKIRELDFISRALINNRGV
jgi:hypothetical protein